MMDEYTDTVEQLADLLETRLPVQEYEQESWRHGEPSASLAWSGDGLERNIHGIVLDYDGDPMLYLEANAWQDRSGMREWTNNPVGLYDTVEMEEAVEEAYEVASSIDPGDLDRTAEL
ncbi:MAG: hypothetical protein SVU32_06765 [Candidatus Nanohaloarchaea archaeon]|nr:hypothetical protein [Candidatus Nanohaloarchaea archaeon]